MGKPVPQGKKSMQLILSDDLHHQITVMAGRGKADDLIEECLRETIPHRWLRWLEQQRAETQQAMKSAYHGDHESRQSTVRRGPQADAGKTAAKNVGDKDHKKGGQTA